MGDDHRTQWIYPLEYVRQDYLAKEMGVTRQTINAIERGKYDPSVQLAFKLARFFECSIEDIFFYEE
ncbi:helix-turn-helix transcriptional regulator [Methanohalobium sp.]|uniref:helix-turn-helix transcriptional regulator n=1 Tax=Methanohalobium sp. TaxID=2837493 RepID=UPI0031830A26